MTTLTTIEPATLTTDEADELADHEATIEQSQAVFVEVGNSLMAIRDAKLYRASHPTFDAYLADRWPAISKRRGYQLIDAAAIAKTIPITNERQARALKGVPAEQAKQAFADATQATNGHVTGKAIASALNQRSPSGDFPAWQARAAACNVTLTYNANTDEYVLVDAGVRKITSQWGMVVSYVEQAELTRRLQQQALAATQPLTAAERTARVQAAQATLTTPIADAYAAGREAELETRPSQELITARRYQSKLSSGMHNLDNPKDRQQVRQLCADLLDCLNTIDGLPSFFDKVIEAVLTQAADLLADDDYADLAKRLEGVVMG